MLQTLKNLTVPVLAAVKKVKDFSVVSLLALAWLGFTLLMFLFNARVGIRLLPIFAIGFFAYFVYMTIKMWPKAQEEKIDETKTTKNKKNE